MKIRIDSLSLIICCLFHVHNQDNFIAEYSENLNDWVFRDINKIRHYPDNNIVHILSSTNIKNHLKSKGE